jgi:hypothetical protein
MIAVPTDPVLLRVLRLGAAAAATTGRHREGWELGHSPARSLSLGASEDGAAKSGWCWPATLVAGRRWLLALSFSLLRTSTGANLGRGLMGSTCASDNWRSAQRTGGGVVGRRGTGDAAEGGREARGGYGGSVRCGHDEFRPIGSLGSMH